MSTLISGTRYFKLFGLRKQVRKLTQAQQNFWLYEETMESDPSGQLAWLVTELEAAETAGERVWLMGHMPMGSSDAFHDQSEYFGKS